MAFVGDGYGVVLAVGGEEAQMLHVLNLQQCRLVELHAEVGKQAVEEVEHVEAQSRLLAVGIEHPVGVVVFIDVALFVNARAHVLQRNDAVAGRAVLVQPHVLVADAGIAERPADSHAFIILIR